MLDLDIISAALGLALGAFSGALIVWLALRPRIERLRAELQAALGAAELQRQAIAAQTQQMRQAYEALQLELHRVSEAWRVESGYRAAAEEKNSRIPRLELELDVRGQRMDALREENGALKVEISEQRTLLEEERKAAEAKLALLDDAQRQLSDAFKALSAEALRNNNQSFLELAKENLEKFQENAKGDLQTRQQAIGELVKPLKESLEKVNAQIGEVEKARTSAYAGLTEQVRSLALSQGQLQSETANLVKALRSPVTRGRWGEIQLQRVAEMAGMLEYCDFVQQESAQSEDGRLRPDMIVRLPSEKNIVVDSKVSLHAYLEAIEAPDEETRVRHLKQHARQVANHMTKLGEKRYWEQFNPTPEFVVLFLPGEQFFGAALEQDPSLIEQGVDKKVIIATPTTLIALLRAVAYGWRQDQLARNAVVIGELGRDLYKRIAVLAQHFDDMRKGLDRAANAYNKAVGTLESRVLVTMRRFKDLGVSDENDLQEMQAIETSVRLLQAEEFDPGREAEEKTEE